MKSRDGKWEESEKRREEERESLRRKKIQVREKVGKSQNTVFFPMICVSGGSTSRLAKAAGAEPAGQMRDEKLHAVVARSTFPSQNVQSTPCTDHFWRFRCRKKCTPLWREAHFQVKMYKALGVRTTFGSWDVEKVHAVVARSTFPSQNVQNTPCTDHFWRFRCRFAWQAQGIVDLVKSEQNVIFVAFSTTTTTTLHYTPIHYTTLHYNYTFTTLHSTTLHCTQLHSITLHYTTLHYSTLHYTTLHYLPLHYITLHSTTLHFTTLHYTTLHYITTTLHYIPLHSTTLHSITLHYTKFHYLPLHYTTLHCTTLHYTTPHYTTPHHTRIHYTTLRYTTLHWMTLRHR